MDRLFARPVAGVAGVVALGRMRLVAEMLCHLALERVFDQPLGQLLENAALAEDLLGALALDQLGEQLVGSISFLLGHDSLL